MQNFDIEDEDNLVVSLPLEDGTELDCDVILIFELEGQDYVALYPCDGEPDEVYLYRCHYEGGNNMDIEEIDDEAEYDNVVEAYESIMEEDEWNELLGYDD